MPPPPAPRPVERLPEPARVTERAPEAPKAPDVAKTTPDAAGRPDIFHVAAPSEGGAKPPGVLKRIGGAGVDTMLNAIRSKPVQFATSVATAIAIIPIALFLVPKIVDTFLTGLGATKEQKSWIYWGTALILGAVGFVLIWRFFTRRRVKK